MNMNIVLNKKNFMGFLLLPTELQRLCLEFFTLQDIVHFDSSYSNRPKLDELFKFYSSYITNNHTYTSVESVRWIIKKMPRLKKYKLMIPYNLRINLPTLHYICDEFKVEDIFSNILTKGQQNINEKDFKGMTVLHHASSNGDLKKVILLVNSNINIDTQDYNGCTALYYACLNRHYEIILYLRETCRANIHIRAYDGNCPLDLINQALQYDKKFMNYYETHFSNIVIGTFFIWYYWWLYQILTN